MANGTRRLSTRDPVIRQEQEDTVLVGTGGVRRQSTRDPVIRRIKGGGGLINARGSNQDNAGVSRAEDISMTDTLKKVQPQRAGFNTKGGILRPPIKRTVTPFSALEASGQSKIERQRLSALDRTAPGTQIGNFSIATRPRAQEGKLDSSGAVTGGAFRGGKKPGIFTQKGTENLFQSMSDLAQKFLSPEFQKQQATKRGAAVSRRANLEERALALKERGGVLESRKGSLANRKAQTEAIKASSGVIKDLFESGVPEEQLSPLVERLMQQISGGNQDEEIANTLVNLNLPRNILEPTLEALLNR